MQDAVKWPAKKWRWMPVWSWEEIRAAGIHILGQQEADFRERYERWLGIPCYVHQLLDEADQSTLDDAIDQCGMELLKQSYTSLTAHNHKLIHQQVQPNYLKGRAEIVKGYTEDRLIAKYVNEQDNEVGQFLQQVGVILTLQPSGAKFWKSKKHTRTWKIEAHSCAVISL